MTPQQRQNELDSIMTMREIEAVFGVPYITINKTITRMTPENLIGVARQIGGVWFVHREAAWEIFGNRSNV